MRSFSSTIPPLRTPRSLTDSKLRNDEDYRLMFYPSIVVDGDHLLTGTRQAMDLESVMENQTVSWTGLDDVMSTNGTLRWNASVNETLTVWLVGTHPARDNGRNPPFGGLPALFRRRSMLGNCSSATNE